MTRLEISNKKLARLKNDFDNSTQAAFSHMAQANGQPMNDKRNGRAFFNKQEELERKIFNLLDEIKKQEERIETLKNREFRKESHLSSNYGLQNSVYNIEEFKKRKQNKATREKIKNLEFMVEKAKTDEILMSEKVKQLIKSEAVKQWDKKPIYYFVAGLRKVAFIIDKNGDFTISKQYTPQTEKDKDFVNAMLGKEVII